MASAAIGCGLSDKDVAQRRRSQPARPPAGASGAAGAGTGASAGSEGGSADAGGGGTESGSGSAGDPGGGGAGLPTPTFDAGSALDRNAALAGELCDRLATIQCAGEGACCPRAGRGFDACKSDLTATCASKLYLDQIAAQPS
ncbi:MAG TPA: hypothetical protein VK509_16005, partial [Polyangiales bacterium]|nr:hypothetical protein [Polyangiales bacterium]